MAVESLVMVAPLRAAFAARIVTELAEDTTVVFAGLADGLLTISTRCAEVATSYVYLS